MHSRTMASFYYIAVFLVFSLLGMPASAGAVSRVFVQNNTLHSLPVSIQLTGQPLASEYWGQSAATVGPGQRAEVLWFNRDTGITDGESFRFASHVMLDGHQVDLVQELHGKTVNSHKWQTVCVDGVCDQWYDNNDDHWLQVPTAGEPTPGTLSCCARPLKMTCATTSWRHCPQAFPLIV